MITRKKNGVELTMNTMIIAALVLIILLVLAFIFIKQSGTVIKANSCDAHEGKCTSTTDACPEGYSTNFAWACDKEQKCCTQFFNTK